MLHDFQVSKLSLHVQEDMGDTPSALATLTEEQLSNINTKDTQFAITVLEEQLAQMKPNMAAIAEYRKKVTLQFSLIVLMHRRK